MDLGWPYVATNYRNDFLTWKLDKREIYHIYRERHLVNPTLRQAFLPMPLVMGMLNLPGCRDTGAGPWRWQHQKLQFPPSPLVGKEISRLL